MARGTTVLVDHTLASGNFAQVCDSPLPSPSISVLVPSCIALILTLIHQVTHLILQRLTPGDQKQSYSYDKQVFHIHIAAGVTYLAMCEENFERRVAYAFLNEIRERFNRAYGQQAMTAMAYAMNKEFSKILGEQMKHFTSSPSADKVRKVQSEIDDVKQVGVAAAAAFVVVVAVVVAAADLACEGNGSKCGAAARARGKD